MSILPLNDEQAKSVRMALRISHDWITLTRFRFAKQRPEEKDAHPTLSASFAAHILNLPGQEQMFANKLHNLRLASSKIDCTVLRPGEIFSFWNMVGPTDERHGFRAGSVFSNNRLIFSVGGSLCQLSGVLYNTALLSGMQILERFPHSVDLYGSKRYIPLGLDATLVYGFKDLRFRNAGPESVLVRTSISDSEARAGIYFSGDAKPFGKIVMEVKELAFLPRPEITEQDPASNEQYVKAEGADGYQVATYRHTEHIDGRTITEKISEDIYKAMPKITCTPRQKP